MVQDPMESFQVYRLDSRNIEMSHFLQEFTFYQVYNRVREVVNTILLLILRGLMIRILRLIPI